MEPVESFMEMLGRAWRDDDKQALARIFGNAPGHLQSVPDKHRETAVRMIFDKNKGIFKFVNSVLDMQAPCINQYDKILKQVFRVLRFIMEFFKLEYEAYILLTKVACLRCIKEHISLCVKIEASKTFKLLIQLFHAYDLELDKIVELYKDIKVFIIVVGAIARYCPKTKNLESLADSIYFKLLIELNEQCKLSGRLQQQEYIKIYLDCLSDMMMNFKPFKESPNSDYYKKLYNIFSLLCEHDNTSEIKNKTIIVLISQIQQFSTYIFKDYKKWHNLFQCLCNSDPIIGEDATKAFYKIMSLQLMETYDEDTFFDFKNYFSMKLSNEKLSCNELSLVIYGFGYFSAVYAKYSPLEINEVFQKISYRTISFPAKKNDAQNVQMLPSYLQAVTQISNYIPNFKTHHLDITVKLSVFIFEKFPELNDRNKINAINALKITFKNIYKLEQIFQRQYFDRMFYKRILWSCSHPLFIDVELQQEIQNLSEHPVCYKDSLQLWHDLLQIDNNDDKLVINIFKEIISVLFNFVEKLNLNVKSQQNKFRPDVSLSHKAYNEAHFRYFINLVDLYVDIFKEVDVSLLQMHVERLLRYFINCSYKHPIVSGFYKLIEAIFKKLDDLYNYETHFHKYTCELISQYLLDVLQRISGFSDELLLSCIYLIFSTPLFFIRDIVDETISVFEVALKIGLKNNIPLTFHALETLEKWSSSFKFEYLHEFWKNLIFYIEPYFAMQPNFEDVFQEIPKIKPVLKSTEKDKSLETLKKKILTLYSSLDQKILMNVINEKSIDTDSLWTKKKLLLLKLHFTDIQFEISFDKFISRVIELTETENRRKKISACEFLHILVTLILGRKVTDYCFKNLFYIVLKLGCDMDDTIWNLYHPLVIQLTHYLSSKQMIESKVSQEFVNSLFDGLSQEFNPSLRDYCGICLKEFVRWMIKQSPGNDSSKSTNFSDLFNRIINFALHQSNNKRLAAVIAFNYLYIILEGSISVINTYWLEFLYAFVKCLEKCNDIRVVSALNNVESVIGVTQGILNAKSFDRRRHIEFSSETLRGATMWLFSQCGVLNAHCREKSMQLFENLCILVTGYKYVKDFISSCGIGCVNAIALKNLDEHFESININNTKTFLRSLDFYIWMFKKKYLTPKCVLLVENDNEGKGIFFKFFTKFVSKFIDNNIRDFIKTTTSSFKEAEELNNSLNTVMLRIIDFTSIVLVTEEKALDQILENLWSKNLNLLISRFTLCPRDIGLTSKSLQTFPPHVLENWFRLMMEKLPEPYLTELKENFFKEKTEDCKNFVNISEIISLKKDVHSLGDFVYGMIILRNCKFYNPEKEHELSIDYSKKIILSIFEGLKVVKMNGYANTKAEASVTTYLKDLLRFFLLEYKPELLECVVDLITSDPSFASSSDSAAGHHEEFYEPLKVPIFLCMLKNPATSLHILDSKLRDSPDKLFALIENLLYFAQRNHTKQSDLLANEVIKNCDNYRALLGENDRRLDRFFSVNAIAVELNFMDVMPADGTPSGLYGWILEEFNKAEDLERKAAIIESFLICMTDETNKQNPDLTLVLWNLRPGNTETWLRDLRASEIERSRAVQCLRSLLKMLLVTKSWIVFEGLIKYAAGACKLFAKESIAEHVKSYFTSIVADSIYQLLGSIYQIFQDAITFSVDERLDILEFFLLPSLEACRVSVVGKFYEHTRVELANILTNGLNELEQTERKQSLVSRIGSFRIFELMFGRLTSPAKDSVDLLLLDKSLEVRSFSSTIADDKEIVRLLHCAALNCCIAVVGSKGDDERHAVVFREIAENNILFWERIVDCERKYNFQPGLPCLKKRTINIRRTPEDLQIPIEPTFDFYFSRYDPTDIDFNKSNNPTDRRQSLSLEEDEFNEHECAAMITGAIVHLSKSMSRLPDVGDEVAEADLPLWLLCFRDAFNTSKDNVRLLLLRIVSNARNIFVPYLRSMFEELAKTVTHYLKENALNYLVRNILFIFIECKYDLKSELEVSRAQKLFEAVIDRSMDENDKVCLYNVQMLEGLVNMWEERLQTPNNLETIIAREEELAIKIVLMLFRHHIDTDNLIKKREVHVLVRKLMFRWQEPTAPQAFETLGWIMRSITDQQRDVLVKDDLVDLFVDMQRLSKDICVRNFYLTFIGCPILSTREELRRFRDPVPLENDERRAECFEIFLESMTNLTTEEIFSMLNSMNLEGLLRDRVLPCIDIGFRILYRLTFILEDPQLLPFAQVIEVYTRKEALLEHKKMAYAFFMHIYEKRTNQDNRMDVEAESNPSALLLLSRKVLINGTIDSSDEVQDLLLTFWKERLADITSTAQRLYHLFKLYTPENHFSFAQFFCVMMLDLTTHSPVDNRILFAPLAECWFEEHEVATPRRWERRRKRSLRAAPLFAPSLTGMLERAVVEQGSRMRRLDRDERLQETPAGALAMSLDVIDRLTKQKLHYCKVCKVCNANVQMPNGPTRIERAPDPSRIQTSHQKKETSPSLVDNSLVGNYYERVKQETLEQRDSARINRRYRIGSYPDIEITQSDVVVTLDDLVRQDAKFANDLVVSIICAMAENIEDEAFHREYINAVAEFCRNVLKKPNDFAPTAMQLLLQTKCTDFDVQDVTRLAKAMGHQTLGILLLEMVSIERNKSKYTYQTQSMFASAIVQPLHHNLELSNLYRSIGECDVVECISRNWILPAGLEHLHAGCIEEAEGDWIAAKARYGMACEILDGTYRDHCVDGLLRCFGELSSWTEINKKVEAILNNDYKAIWQNPKKDDLLPWILKGQLQKRLDDIASGRSSEIDFTDHLDSWIDSHGTCITKRYGDELCMFYLCSGKEDSETTARRCLQDCLEYTCEQSVHSIQRVMKLKKIRELEAYLITLRSKDLVGAAKELMNYWEKTPLNDEDDLLIANQCAAFRLAFANVLIDKLKDTGADSGVLIDVLSASLSERLKISELAIANRNRPLAHKHTMRVERILNQFDKTDVHYAKLRANFDLTASSYKFMCGDSEYNPPSKTDYYLNAWQLADTVTKTESFDLSTRIKAKRHIVDITSKLLSTISSSVHCVQLVMEDQFTRSILDLEAADQVWEKVLEYRWKILKDVCKEGSNKEMAESYTKFIEYCCGLIDETGDRNPHPREELISAVLTGMSLGSTKAARYFPRLLRTSLYRSNELTLNAFVEKCKTVPTWLFLSWQEQIQSCLITSLMPITLPIVERLAKDYPSAIIYDFRRICQDYPNLRNNSTIDDIYKTLFSEIRIETFFKAMEYICQPEQYLRYNLTSLLRLANDREIFSKALDAFLEKISETSNFDAHLKGPVYKEVFGKHCNVIKKLKSISNNETIEVRIQKLCADLDISMTARLRNQKSIKSSQLANYSPYLSDFVGEDIGMEVPGQYIGDKKPLTQSHAKIARIEGLVEVINGCGYLKISLLGTNAQSNEFLVKIGTDLRCDQRMQRIFKLMNEAMLHNTKYKKRKLSICTYNVVPLSKSMGLIQWVSESKSLKEFITLWTPNKSDLYRAENKYQSWIEEAAIDKTSSKSEIHRQALLKYEAKDVVAKMDELSGSFSWDLLRKAFMQLSQSSEDFFKLRQNFIRKYATMCAVHWLMGVGDRRLEKILIETKTGKCFGLDFRVAFGAGVDQPIPELVPFRLTMQILGLFRPFGEKDLLGSTMSCVLDSLRKDKNLILTCLHAYLNEPLDWNEKLDEMWRASNKSTTWLTKEKIEIVRRKLNGVKPSDVTLDELLCMLKGSDVEEKKYFGLYKHIVNGTELHHFTARSFITQATLTPKEQVLCLLDQATDKNVLGRMPPKWIPFL